MEGKDQFNVILSSLQSAQKDVRSSAEQAYELIPATQKLSLLLNVILNKIESTENRVFSGVLCRRLIDVSYEDSFECLSLENQETIKNQLLQLLSSEEDSSVRKKLSEIILEIARKQFDDEGTLKWMDLLRFVFDTCVNNVNSALRTIGLNIFSGLPNMVPMSTEANLNLVGTILNKCMSPQTENQIEVRKAAVRAFCALVSQEFEDNASVGQLRFLLPTLLQTIFDAIQDDPFDDDMMKTFVELVDEAPGFLKNNVVQVLQLCIGVLQNEDVEECQKHLAVEVFVSMSESCTNAVRKSNDAMHIMMQYLFNMLTDIEDDAEWATCEDEEREDDSSNHITAEIALDRLAVAMKGKKLLEEIKNTVPAMLRNGNWKARHGGLKALASMGEGLQKVMGEILPAIVTEVVTLLNDEHPRVRYAACVCLGQMSTDFEPKIQTNHHEQVMPALMDVLGRNEATPRVQSYVCCALTNFCEGASRDVLCLYLPTLAHALLAVIKAKCMALKDTHKKMVLEQAITTVAAVSDTAGERFSPYYSEFMSIAKWMMVECNGVDELRLLRGKSIECISLMGLAVGKAQFLADGQEVMSMLSTAQTTAAGTTSDDPQHSYMISAWARICKLMGTDFAPYLQYVMGPVLETASMRPETCFMYDDEKEDMAADQWQVIKVGQDQNVAINTSGIEDKVNACQMLICYARELKHAFAPYVDHVAKVMMPLLKFYLNDDVRSAAADIMPFLLDASESLGEQVRTQLWRDMFAALLEALNVEEEKLQQADMLDAISECMDRMGRASIESQDSLTQLCHLMTRFFDELFASQEARVAKRKAADYDADEEEEDLEADQDDDDNILGKLACVSHSLFKAYGQEMAVFFQTIVGYVNRLMEPGRPHSDLQFALCFIDDVIEFTGHCSFQCCEAYLPVYEQALGHVAPEVRQSALYGIGLMAEKGGPQYAAFLARTISAMVGLVVAADSRSVDNNLSTENAISALTKVAKYQPQCLPGPGDVDSFLGHWVSWLPVYEDDEETPHVYGYLCDLIEARHHVMVTNEHVVKAVQAIAACVSKQGLPKENAAYTRCMAVVRSIQTNQQLFSQCVQALSHEEQVSLNEALTAPAM